ncbi:PAT complex subunit Asterix-like [Styela clava]
MEVVDTKKKNSSKIVRYKPQTGNLGDDPLPDYINLVSMIFSMCGLMLKIKWCAWASIFGSLVSFANSRSNDDGRQVLSSFMLSVSSVVMTYLHNPAPMTPPW